MNMKLEQTSPNRPSGRISQILRTTIALALAVPTVASATIIASDTFNSYDGSTAIVGQSGASNNWANGWSAGAAGSVTAYSTNATLAYTPPGGSAVAGGRTIEVGGTGTGIPAFRQIYNPLTNTFYVGALLRWGGTLNSGDGVTILLTDNLGNTTNCYSFGLLGLWSTVGTTVRKGTAGTFDNKPLPSQNGTYYMVLKIEKTGGTNYDRATGWINPNTLSETTNSAGDIQLNLDSGIPSISHLLLRGAGLDAGDATRIESLALATTYADLMAAPGDGPANPAPVDTLRVETLADGSGVVVPTQTITSGASLTNFAIARDSGGGNLGNVVATAWYLTNITGSVVAGDLVRSLDAKSAVFKGVGAGTAQIVAIAGATNFVFSGTITVQLATPTQVLVETQPDGSGTVLAATNLTSGQTVTGYSISRDAGNNFIANIAATWSLVNLSNNVVSSDLVPAGGNLSATFTAGVLPGSANIRATSGILTSVDSGLITVLRQLTWSGTNATWNSSQVNWFLPDLTTLSNFVTGDSLTFNDTGAANVSVTLSGSLSPKSVTVAGTNAYTLGGTGNITGAATFTTTSSALLTITNDNDYTGETTVRGNIQLGGGGSTGSLGTGKINFTLANKTLSYNRTNALTLAQQVTGTSSGTVAVNSGTLTLAGAAGNTSLKVTVASNATVVLAKTSGEAVGNAGLVVNAGGVAKIGDNNSQINGNVDSQIDGTVDLQGFNQGIRVLTGVPCTGTFDSTVFGAGGCTLSVGNSSVAQSFAGEIKDTGWDATHKLSLTKTGGQIVELGGTNTYHGNTTIAQSSLRLTSSTAIPHGANFGNVVFSGGSLNLNGYNITVNGISGGNTISDGTATTTMFTVGDGDATASYSSVISGTFGVTKIGAGVQTLTGTNTYTGNTVVSNGTLQINGALTGTPSVTVAAQGTLGGTGTIAGVVTNKAGGTLSPGASIGTLTLSGGLVLEAGSTNTFEVDGSTPTNDVVVLGAAVTYGGVLNIVPTGTFTNGQTFELFSGAGAANASNFGSLTGNPGVGLGFTFTNGVLSVVSTGGPAGTNANLLSLVLNPAGTLSPSFSSNVFTYTATNAFSDTPTVTVVNADLTATNQLIYNGATNALPSGVPGSGLTLTLGVNNPVVVRVTAQDGLTVQTYTVNVTKLPSQTAPTLSKLVSGGTLTLSWPASHLGYTLQQQTNSRSLGLSTNWVALSGSVSVTSTNIPIDATKPTVFYRLVYP